MNALMAAHRRAYFALAILNSGRVTLTDYQDYIQNYMDLGHSKSNMNAEYNIDKTSIKTFLED